MQRFDPALPESKTYERKRDLTARDSILRAAVAFANGSGGQIAIGIDDDGAIVGVTDPILVEEQLVNIIVHGTTPMVVPDVSVIDIEDRNIVLAAIAPSARAPHHITALGSVDGTYIRIGSSNRRADEPLRLELARMARRSSADEEPVAGVSASDLDVDRHLGVAFAPVARQRTLQLIDQHSTATLAGVLLAAPDIVRSRYPDVVVHAVIFTDDDTALVRRDLHGTIVELIEQSIDFVSEALGTGIHIAAGQDVHAKRPAMPDGVVRELVINAFTHADYTLDAGPFRIAIHPDRVVIENPGLLVTGMLVDDLGNGVSRLRNRSIGRVLRELGYIEQWGSGTRRVARLLDESGLPGPTYTELPPGRFRVELARQRMAAPQISDAERTLLAAVRERPQGASTSQLVADTGRSERWVRQHASSLLSRGLLVVRGAGPQRRYLVTE